MSQEHLFKVEWPFSKEVQLEGLSPADLTVVMTFPRLVNSIPPLSVVYINYFFGA